MTIGKTIIRSNILDKFTNCLIDCDISDISINVVNKPSRHFSAFTHETVEVEFLAEESKIGKLIKRIVHSANKGKFGKNKIILAPFRTI